MDNAVNRNYERLMTVEQQILTQFGFKKSFNDLLPRMKDEAFQPKDPNFPNNLVSNHARSFCY